MKRIPSIAAALGAALTLLAACREPMSVETYLKGPGPYEFKADLGDTTAVYDLTFYTRVDHGFRGVEIPGELPLTVTWTSPSDSVRSERVYLPLDGEDDSFYSRSIVAPYRSGVVPAEPGVWRITVALDRPGDFFHGLGLILSKSRNGTR